MSDIYVKWVKLGDSSCAFENCSRTLSSYAQQVESIRDRLKLSDEVSSSIKSSLSKNASELYALSNNMSQYASSLRVISELYKTTEESNTNR